jgi:hypothetical protein
MNRNPANWEALLGGGPRNESSRRKFYLLKRGGHELLAIPANHRGSPDAVGLYLPQTWKARLAKTIFRLALAGPLAGLLPSRQVDWRKADFTDFLCSLSDNHPPDFCVLSGNPAEPGRRFLFGLLDEKGRCYRVVKCAADPVGRELIDHEAAVLGSLGNKLPGIPGAQAALSTDDCSAFAMDFFPAPDRVPSRSERVALVRQWISQEPPRNFSSLHSMPRPGDPDVAGSDLMIKPAIFHGDFAPWNIRHDGRNWMVIDWEKARLLGPPLWDLLHYEIHEEILVHRSSVGKVRQRIHSLIQDPCVRSYLADCGAAESVDLLLQGYLLHLDMIYPAIRGRRTVDELIASYRR